MSIKEIYQTYLDASYEDRLKEAISASKVVLNYLKSKSPEDKASEAYLLLVATYVGADGSVQTAEYEFCKKVFDFELSFDEFYDMVNAACTAENVELVDGIIDSSPADVKVNFVSLGIAICSSNGTMTVREQQLLAKYIA